MKAVQQRTSLLFLAIAFFFCHTAAQSQLFTPYLSGEGVGRAEQLAKDSLGSGAKLIMIATQSGTDPSSGFSNEFDLATGKSSVWIYMYYDFPTQKAMTTALVNIPLLGFQGPAEVSDTIDFPSEAESRILDLTGQYASSDRIAERLQTNADYQMHRSEFPGMKPLSATMTAMVPELVPIGVDPNQPVWVISYEGMEDSSLTCVVGTRTGEVVCQRAEGPPLSVPQSDGARGTAALSVAPNPASGRTRITIDLPEGIVYERDMSLRLYNEMGEEMLDLTESFISNDHRYVEFDAKQLPAGVYYCRALGSNWQGIVGVVVEK